ncbi:hypothetical protein [Rhodococcus qingshengii]|uniref:hypothetical protein n=1 Tax=Rhodococcus qingshengii TaxID=334542 RepID=UPI001C8C0AAA|nr:hypothetical protein [Rhodococcus qingshengii]MBX9150060.1 hypothetical protein [Rhodococcus qingshengii]
MNAEPAPAVPAVADAISGSTIFRIDREGVHLENVHTHQKMTLTLQEAHALTAVVEKTISKRVTYELNIKEN